MDRECIVNIETASFSYEKHQVFSNVSMKVMEGESVGIIGANGSGKSTLLKMISGLVGHEGALEVFGLEMNKVNQEKIRKKLGFVFQDSDSQLFMPTVYDDMAFAPRNFGYSEEETEQMVSQALSQVGISHLKDRQNYKLSGGEKRMVCIAEILAMNPELILLDEPSITLDPYNRRKLIESLNGIETTKIIACHDLDMIYETCERVIILGKNGIISDGDTMSILSDEKCLLDNHLELPLFMQKPVLYRRENGE